MNKPNNPLFRLSKARANISPSTPGIGMCAPVLTTINTLSVKIIRERSPGIVNTFYLVNHNSVAVPPAFSILCFADLLKTVAVI